MQSQDKVCVKVFLHRSRKACWGGDFGYAEALKCNDEHPPEGAQLTEQPEAFYVSEIIEDMCAG